MNNYLRLLLHLKQFEGDGNQHPVEHLFPDSSEYNIRSILQELSDEGLIKFTGRETRYLSFVVEQNLLTNQRKITESPLNEHILKTDPPPFKAKITFKGSKHLKEELQMQESGKYNIAVTGQGATNNFVIESQNVTIDNKTNFEKRLESIVETLQNDPTVDIETKNKAITDLQLAKTEIEQNGKISSSLVKTILEYGSNISSIGQLVLGLLAT